MSQLHEKHGWILYHYYNPELLDTEDIAMDTVEDTVLSESQIEETTGSGWMFYHHYNPDLLKSIQRIITGDKLEDVVDSLLEDEPVEESAAKLAGAAGIGAATALGASHIVRGKLRQRKMRKLAQKRWAKQKSKE